MKHQSREETWLPSRLSLLSSSHITCVYTWSFRILFSVKAIRFSCCFS